MMVGKTLIDEAAKRLGSRYRVAQLLGESEANLGTYARGERPIPPRLAGKVATLISIDPREAACAAIVEAASDEDKRRELESIFQIPPPGMLWLHLQQGIKAARNS